MRFSSLALLALLPGCATIFDGTHQGLAVVTEPSGALCAIDRAGTLLGTTQTPGLVQVERSQRDLGISCVKDGYTAVTAAVPSHFTGATFANFGFFPSVVGIAAVLVDATSGANWAYTSSVTLRMAPGQALPPRPVPALDPSGLPAS